MKPLFTRDQVFQVAMEMEQTGEVFYEALAASSRDERTSRLCRRLAREETEHFRTFKNLREGRSRAWPARPMTEDQLTFTRSLIKEKLIPTPEEARRVALHGGAMDALDMGIKMEDDSVKFYEELLAGAEASDAEAIELIIKEEREHARALREVRGGLA